MEPSTRAPSIPPQDEIRRQLREMIDELATLRDELRVRAHLAPGIQIKASGGIRTLRDAQAMVEAGATRIGTSSGISILEEARNS